jgi:hypothetical protein
MMPRNSVLLREGIYRKACLSMHKLMIYKAFSMISANLLPLESRPSTILYLKIRAD